MSTVLPSTLPCTTPRYSTGVPLARVSPVAAPRAMWPLFVVFIAPPFLPPAIAFCRALAKSISRAL